MKTLSTFILLLNTLILFSQTPTIEWQSCISGSSDESGNKVRQTSDGGYIVIGRTRSTNGDIVGNHGDWDIIVIKMNSIGFIDWKKCYGGSSIDTPDDILQTPDGGYIFIGSSSSNDGQVIGGPGEWIVKLDNLGNILWQKTLLVSGESWSSIIPSNDGGFIVCGAKKTGLSNDKYCWLAKINSSGVIQWQQTYGNGTSSDIAAHSVYKTLNGDYILTGTTSWHQNSDIVVIKTDSLGNLIWLKTYGGSSGYRSGETGYEIIETIDSCYIFVATSSSYGGDITNYKGSYDIWVVKIDTSGTIVWEKSLGGTSAEHAVSIFQSSDGSYLVTGYTDSNDKDVIGNHSNKQDVWTVKLNSSGTILWSQCIGGTDGDLAYGMSQTNDGGYIFTGIATSTDGDVIGNNNYPGGNLWTVKMGSVLGLKNPKERFNISLFPNPSNGIFEITGLESKNSIEVYDIMGRTIYSVFVNSTSKKIDLSTQPKGLYFYKVINENNQTQQGKLVVQ